jgi:RNA polymerase sigma-70 factor (ECF subfamily)
VPVRETVVADGRFASDPLEELARQERDHSLAEALTVLDDVTRSVVVLRYYDNLPSKRIGELLELTPAAVDMRLSRARQQLRQILSGPLVKKAAD